MDYESMPEYWKGHEDGYGKKPYQNPFPPESNAEQAYANGFQMGKLEIEKEEHDRNHHQS